MKSCGPKLTRKTSKRNTASVLGASSSSISDHVLYHHQQQVLLFKEEVMKQQKLKLCFLHTKQSGRSSCEINLETRLHFLTPLTRPLDMTFHYSFWLLKLYRGGLLHHHSKWNNSCNARTISNLPWLDCYLEALRFFESLLLRGYKCNQANINR